MTRLPWKIDPWIEGREPGCGNGAPAAWPVAGLRKRQPGATALYPPGPPG